MRAREATSTGRERGKEERGEARDRAVRQAVRDLQDGRRRESSFRVIHHAFHGDLLRFFRRRGWSREEAEDLVQETFLSVTIDIGGFRHEAPFRAWLYALAANCVRRTLRYRAAHKRTADEVALDTLAPMAVPSLSSVSAPSPLEHSLHEEQSARLRCAARQLPRQMRRCVLLGLERGYSAVEIGQALSIKPSTVRVTLFRARSLLRTALGDAGTAGASAGATTAAWLTPPRVDPSTTAIGPPAAVSSGLR